LTTKLTKLTNAKSDLRRLSSPFVSSVRFVVDKRMAPLASAAGRIAEWPMTPPRVPPRVI
jgi:hypothetical protein